MATYEETTWYWDIEIYLQRPNAAEPSGIEIATHETLYHEYGPITYLDKQQITLAGFLDYFNDRLETQADANDWPEFHAMATPYLTLGTGEDPNAPGGGGLVSSGGGPAINPSAKPAHRKLDKAPMDSGVWMANVASGADRGFVNQMIVRYDISILSRVAFNDKIIDYAEKVAADNGSPASEWSYYGFKIYWHRGRSTEPGVAFPGHPHEPYATMQYTTWPDAPVVEMPYSAPMITCIQDDLPLPPNIQFVPFMGINNKLLVLLNSNTGVYHARPVVVLEKDLEKLVDIFANQKGVVYTTQTLNNLLNTAPPRAMEAALAYEADDPVKKYEIFRMTELPTSYRDFANGLNPIATPTGNISIGKDSTAASYIDTISPNIKYYYCARAVDMHDNFSNPSFVYEIQLVDNEGQVYIISKTIAFESQIKRSNTKAGRRFVYIEPALHQLTLGGPSTWGGLLPSPLDTITADDIPQDEILGQYHGGPTDSLWGKTFRLRFTSKKTSRKFDLNITFNNSGVKIP